MLLLLALVLSSVVAGHASAVTKKDLKTTKHKVSYVIGVHTARNLERQAIDLDVGMFVAGARHVLANKPILLADSEMEKILQEFQKTHRQKRDQQMQVQGEKNKKAGEQFLAKNAKDKGVVTLKSGLQYKVLVKGSGPVPKKSDTVVTHYVGTLIDGQEFDSSRRRGSPATFPVGGVIAGWTEALQLMPVGSKWMLYIPSELAYGARGAGGRIGPHATLVFEIELLEISATK